MSAAGWSSRIIVDQVNPRGTATEFEVLSRRSPRIGLTGSNVVPAGAASAAAQTASAADLDCDKSDLSQFLTPSESGVSAGQAANGRARSEPTMGDPALRPCDQTGVGAAPGSVAVGVSVPPMAFGDLPSVRAMGTGRRADVVGFDTEFTTTDRRVIDSYQFAVPDPANRSEMVEVVILPRGEERISLHRALWAVVEEAELWASPLASAKVGPEGVPRTAFWDEDWKTRKDKLAKHRVPIVLASHYGSADLTAFRDDRYIPDHLTRLTSAAGGLVTLMPFRMQRGNANGWWWQSMSVSVRDTMAHAPAGQKSLRDLGLACGVPKLEVPDDWISRMSEYRRLHLAEFLEYGINDAVIVVEYLSRLYGDGILPPITLSGGAAASLVHRGIEYWSVGRPVLDAVFSPSGFRRVFSGLVDEDDGVEAVEEEDRLSFYAKRSRNPIDGAAAQFSAASAKTYHGGLNSCPMPGYYPVPTVDIDAQNAYPTAMALIRDLDWEAGVIDEVIHERWLIAADVPSPLTPLVAFVTFTFPTHVQHPCLPIMDDGTLIYPRTSDGSAGTWVCAPELWAAMQQGAEVYCQIGYVGREMVMPDGGPSQVLRHGVKSLIDDRNTAKEVFGKGSIEELTLKTAVNSVYGKTAQDVTEQRAWDAHTQEMENVGGSAVTSPYHAAMTTSLVRAQLLVTMNQIIDGGGHVYSVTTDGFITDWTLDQVAALDLYGLADILAEAREALTGDPSIWEAKHWQDDLVNFTTRGNVSQSLQGVCAHNGLKVPDGITEDSVEDREQLLRAVVTRDGRVPNGYKRFPSFRELSQRENRKDFIPTYIDKAISMDYDLKRQPVMSSMRAEQVPLPDGSRWEMATFDTRPWETVEEAVRARELARGISKANGCLRTVAQWRDWDVKLTHGKGRRIVTPQRAVLMSIVMAHRQGVVSIPTLADRDLTVPERLDWLGEWGLGTVSRGDWDNARRPERAAQMLPLDVLEPYLTRMLGMPSEGHPDDADRLPY